MITFAREPRRSVALLDLRCRDCGQPRLLGVDTGTVACATPECVAFGIRAELWRALDEAGIDHNPAGRTRPLSKGLPVPWITPVTVDTAGVVRPQWRMVHRGRLAHAQRWWLCQHCGLAADPDHAMVVVDASGWCLTPAALHPRCADESVLACPHLAGGAESVVAVAPDQITRDGELDPDIGITQDWRLPASLY